MNMPSWVVDSLLGVLFVTPAWIAIGFFKKNLGIEPAVTVFWYMLGTATASGLYLTFFTPAGVHQLYPSALVLIMFSVGAFLGAPANIFIFSAVGDARTAGSAVTLQSTSGLMVIFVTAGLAKVFGDHFQAKDLDLQHLAGLVLVIVGVGLVSN